MKNSKGFTLIEIIVAVALVAILSAAIAPSVLNNIAQGRVARAQSDVQAIAQAIMKFKGDTGLYPRLVEGASKDTTGAAFDFLASAGGRDSLVVTRSALALWGGTNDDFTEDNTDGSIQDIEHHLILGASRKGPDSLYVRVPADKMDDPTVVGFRMGVITSDPYDPWGNSYVSNVGALGHVGMPVWVISAGPNGLFETTVNVRGDSASATLAGDDIGFRIQ